MVVLLKILIPQVKINWPTITQICSLGMLKRLNNIESIFKDTIVQIRYNLNGVIFFGAKLKFLQSHNHHSFNITSQ